MNTWGCPSPCACSCLTDILQAHEMEKRVLYEALERALSHLAVIGTDQAKRGAEEIEAVLSERTLRLTQPRDEIA